MGGGAQCPPVSSSKILKVRLLFRYEAVAPLHTLWLGYMSELLSIPLAISSPYIPSTSSTSTPIPPVQSTSTLTSSTATLIPTFPPRNGDTGYSSSADLNINVGNVHTKLVKAEFVGCLLSGMESLEFTWVDIDNR